MLIRKNTKAFKTILQLFTSCQDRADREKLIRLYITKAGDSIHERIGIEGIEGGAALFYEMTFQTVLNNLKSSNHQLQVSDEVPGVYFFHSSSNKVWDETPFEFDELIKTEFASLPELPQVRKKESAGKFVLPSPKTNTKTKTKTEASPPAKKEKAQPAKVAKIIDKGPKQPDFKLRHPIHFTNLEKLVFRQAKITKQDVLTYYSNIAEYALPYLKDRQLWSVLYSSSSGAVTEVSEALAKNNSESIPDWIKTSPAAKNKEGHPLCNDREHLLYYVEIGCLEFRPAHSRIKQSDSPDYIVIAIESPESELAKAIDVVLTAKEILDGLQLPSFVKTDGMSGLHVYIPSDPKSTFETNRVAAEFVCKLIKLKIPDLVTLKGSSGYVHGKVSIDYTLNDPGKSVVAPYALVAGQSGVVATPLLWEEVEEGLRVDAFNHETIFKRLKQVGDPFEALYRKKVDADALLERLETNYSFLF